jgi:hypothetical protein
MHSSGRAPSSLIRSARSGWTNLEYCGLVKRREKRDFDRNRCSPLNSSWRKIYPIIIIASGLDTLIDRADPGVRVYNSATGDGFKARYVLCLLTSNLPRF